MYLVGGVLIVFSGLLAGCSITLRNAAPPMLVAQVAPVGFPPSVRFVGNDGNFFAAHADDLARRLRRAARGNPLRILALSGGGAGGAFGAGALVGLSRRGDRPDFQVVTGVSVGALIAPFAFLGPAWDQELTKAFDGDLGGRLLRLRGPALLFRAGLFSRRPLVKLVDRFVTDRMIAAVAERAREGRELLVATMDLDKQETVIWDMGAIAAQGGKRALALFREVLIASASIPGIFPPVMIRVEGGGKSYEEMHVDGGATLPFFIASQIGQLSSKQLDVLAKAEVFVLINGQLSAYPKTTKEGPAAVLSRSLSAEFMHSSRRTVEQAAAFAQRHKMKFRFSYLPASYPYQGPLSLKPALMRALFEYGTRCAGTGQLWTTFEQAVRDTRQSAASLPQRTDACPVALAAHQQTHEKLAPGSTVPGTRRVPAHPLL